MFLLKIFNHNTKSSLVFNFGNKHSSLLNIDLFNITDDNCMSQDFNNSFT